MRSVDIPVNQSDLVDTLSSMRVWLDHSEFPVWGFRSTRDAAGVVTLHAEFDEEKGAAAFRDRFGGEGTHAAAPTMPPANGPP